MKNLFARLVSVLAAFFISVTGISTTVIGYTDGNPIKATRRQYAFDNDKLLIGAYYGDSPYVGLADEAGIDFFISDIRSEEFVKDCEQYGIGIIASGNYNVYKDSPAVWGRDVIDEPDASLYKNLADVITACTKERPDELALINLYPAYATEEQLGEYYSLGIKKMFGKLTDHVQKSVDIYKQYVSDYINTIDTDYICVDIYPYMSKLNVKGGEVKNTRPSWVRNLDILAEACRETGRDLWVITQAAGLTKNGAADNQPRYCDEVSDISQQAFACLAFGTKAIIHGEFSPRGWWDPETSHMIGADGKPTDTYHAVKETNSYLAAFADEYGKYDYVGTYMLNPKKVAGFARYGTLMCENKSEMGNVESSNGLLVGNFSAEDGSKAYVIANMEELNDSVKANAVFTLEEGKKAMIYQKGMSMDVDGGCKIDISLEPGDGVYITVR